MKNLRVNGNQLKLFALITMTVDHIGVQLFPHLLILRIIGRLSMPVFAYMIAEGCRYTRNRYKHILLTSALGFLCQIVYFITTGSLYLNILFTFSLSIALIYAFENAIARRTFAAYLTAVSSLLSVSFLCQVLPILLSQTDFQIDYGFTGILLPVLIYFGKNRKQALFLSAFGQILMCLALTGIQWYCLLSLIPVALYDGTRGKAKLKYLFYIYYPAHLAALHGISLLLR